jgi:molecular chaperone GrpE (heat shock protein)
MENAETDKANGGDQKRAKPGNGNAPAAGGSKMNASVTAMTKKLANTLAEEEAKRKANMSSAVASLYAPRNGSQKSKETFMTRGTHTRVGDLLSTFENFTDALSSMLKSLDIYLVLESD